MRISDWSSDVCSSYLYVLATSAEEWGLLGAKAFAENPPLPLESVVAAFNFDSVALAARGAPVGFVGEGKTPLDAVILDAIAGSRREVGDRELADPFIQRQDGWGLLQRGVPAVVLSSALGSRAGEIGRASGGESVCE